MAADATPGPKKQPRFLGTGAPATAADLNILSDHAALVGNRKVGTTAERNAATAAGEVWPRLRWADTTLGIEFEYIDGPTGWVRASRQVVGVRISEGTNANGIIRVQNPFGTQPISWTHVQIQYDQANEPLALLLSAIIWDGPPLGTSGSFQVRFRRSDTGGWAMQQPITCYVICGLEV